MQTNKLGRVSFVHAVLPEGLVAVARSDPKLGTMNSAVCKPRLKLQLVVREFGVGLVCF